MKFIDLLRRDQNSAEPHGARFLLKECLAISRLHFWEPGDTITAMGTRVLIGAATWSRYDLMLLDWLNDSFERIPSDETGFRVDVFNFDDCFVAHMVQADLEQYVPELKLETVFHSPVVGVWRDGVHQESGAGYYGRRLVIEARRTAKEQKKTTMHRFVSIAVPKQFREIGFDGSHITMHEGVVDQTGRITQHSVEPATARLVMKSYRAQAERNGFVERTTAMTTGIIVRFVVNGFGTIEQLQTRHTIEDELDDVLARTGNGQCMGGESGGDEMLIFCQVLCVEEAILATEEVLRKHAYLSGTVCVEEPL